MSMLINRSVALSAVKTVRKAIERKNTLPILSNARIRGGIGNAIDIIGTDLDLDIIARVEAAVESPIDFTLDAETLEKLLTNAPGGDGDARIEGPAEEQGKASIQIGKANYKTGTLPSSDFQMLENHPAPSFSFSGRDLYTYLERVKTAISTEETRYYLNGIYFHQQPVSQTERRTGFVATDGHRLHVQYFETPEGMPEFDLETLGSGKGQPGIIIPTKTINVLHAFLKGKNAPSMVHVEIMDKVKEREEESEEPKRIKFTFRTSFGLVAVISKTIDGTFPDYMRAIPPSNSNVVTLDPADLAEALKGVKVINDNKNARVKFTFEDSVFNVFAKSDDNTAEYPVTAQFDFDILEIGFNARYLLETINGMDAPLEMRFADAGTPALLTSTNMDGFKAVLMPIRV